MPGSGRGGPSRRLRRGLRAQRGARVKLRRGRHHDGFGAETHWRKVNATTPDLLSSSLQSVWPGTRVRQTTGSSRRSAAAAILSRAYPLGIPFHGRRKRLVSVQENHAEARLRRRVARRRRGRLAAARHLLRQPAVPPQAARHCGATASSATPVLGLGRNSATHTSHRSTRSGACALRAKS